MKAGSGWLLLLLLSTVPGLSREKQGYAGQNGGALGGCRADSMSCPWPTRKQCWCWSSRCCQPEKWGKGLRQDRTGVLSPACDCKALRATPNLYALHQNWGGTEGAQGQKNCYGGTWGTWESNQSLWLRLMAKTGTLRGNKMSMKDYVDHLSLSADLLLTRDVGFTKIQPIELAMEKDKASNRVAVSCCWSKPAVPQQQWGHVLLILTSAQGTVSTPLLQICRYGGNLLPEVTGFQLAPLGQPSLQVLGLESIVLFSWSSAWAQNSAVPKVLVDICARNCVLTPPSLFFFNLQYSCTENSTCN